jgi:Tropinone reductase 1
MVLTHAAVQAGAKSIVMVSSLASNVPWPDTAPYNTAKAAQNCLVEQLAFQYRNDNVRINAVLPACIHSVKLDVMAQKKGVSLEDYAALRAQASPVGRNGTVEEVARSVVFLSSSSFSSFTTGVLLPVDGGLHLSNWWNKPHMLAEYKGV